MNWILFLLVGVISGFFIGLLGIGSGVIVVPGLTLAGLTVKQAITTGLLLQAIPQTIPAFLLYEKKGHFKWTETMITLVGSFIGVILGAIYQDYNILSDQQLYTMLSIILILSGIQVFYRNVWNRPLEKEVKEVISPK